MQLFCDGNTVLVCYSLSEFCFRSLTFEARSSYKLRPRCSLMLKEFLQVVFCKIKKCYNFLSFLCCPPGLTVLFGTCTLPVVQFSFLCFFSPIVLDPANPTNNVCQLYQQGTNGREIALAAEQTLQTPLLENVTVRQGWKG